MQIKLSDHFTYSKLLYFTLPSIVMMVITSIYSVVDGLFVSNLVGELALSAVNIMFPVSMILASFGFMLGTGGGAIVARTMGEGKQELANRYFSMIICCVLGLGLVFSLVSVFYTESIARLAGASDLLMDDCIAYGRVLLGGSAVFMLQVAFQVFFVVAEQPHRGLLFSIASGLTNMALDYVLIGPLQMGVAGAAWATVTGYAVGGLLPLFCFLRPGKGALRLTATALYPKQLLEACFNGSSELMSNLSSSVVGILFNLQLMAMIGELGVAAYSVMMYVDFVFVAAFLGFSIGSAPIVSYHYGADNRPELRNVFRTSGRVIAVTSAIMVLASEALSYPLAAAFVGYNRELLSMTVHGFRLFALSYLFCGVNIYASAFFTALCNGAVSALISFLRSFLFRGGMVLLLPLIWDLDGIWWAVVFAEGLGVLVSVGLLVSRRKQYHYW